MYIPSDPVTPHLGAYIHTPIGGKWHINKYYSIICNSNWLELIKKGMTGQPGISEGWWLDGGTLISYNTMVTKNGGNYTLIGKYLQGLLRSGKKTKRK